MLKRAIAREMFKYLTRRVTAPVIDDLRPTRQGKNITLTRAAARFGLWPTALSRIENGTSETTPSHRHTETGYKRLDSSRSLTALHVGEKLWTVMPAGYIRRCDLGDSYGGRLRSTGRSAQKATG
jgi:hypothetical protein